MNEVALSYSQPTTDQHKLKAGGGGMGIMMGYGGPEGVGRAGWGGARGWGAGGGGVIVIHSWSFSSSLDNAAASRAGRTQHPARSVGQWHTLRTQTMPDTTSLPPRNRRTPHSTARACTSDVQTALSHASRPVGRTSPRPCTSSGKHTQLGVQVPTNAGTHWWMRQCRPSEGGEVGGGREMVHPVHFPPQLACRRRPRTQSPLVASPGVAPAPDDREGGGAGDSMLKPTEPKAWSVPSPGSLPKASPLPLSLSPQPLPLSSLSLSSPLSLLPTGMARRLIDGGGSGTAG
jgi:hypothetical protein